MTQLTLKCEKFGLSRVLHDLLSSGDLVDVTLACQGQYIQAHKTVLAACSPHFRSLFKLQPWQHPIVFLQDVDLAKLQALVDFMYNGEVTVEQEDLAGLIRLADALKVTGLATQDKSSDRELLRELLTTEVQGDTLTHSPPPPPTPPPTKIARHSDDCGVSKHTTSPQLDQVATSAQSSSEIEQPPHVEQLWVPAIDNIGNMVQDTWPPCSQTIDSTAAVQAWAPQTGGFAAESLEASASFMMDERDIKVEQDELCDLTEDQGSTNSQDWDAEDDEADDSSHPGDQSLLQSDAWCEAGPSNTEPSTSGPEASTSRLASSDDGASTEQPSQRAAVPGVSSRGHHLRKRVVEPQNSKTESNDEVNLCQELDVYFNCETSPQSHVSKSHDNKDCQPGKVPNKCDLCSNTYKSKAHLWRHYKDIHPTMQRFSCRLCAAEFANYQDLQQHKINSHKKKYPFVCKTCGKQFTQNAHLKQHLLNSAHGKDITMRLGEKTVCIFCFEKFETMQQKTKHIAQHHPEFCLPCRLCPTVFHEKRTRLRHELSVHRTNVEKPEQFFPCQICDFAVTSQGRLKLHMQSVHTI